MRSIKAPCSFAYTTANLPSLSRMSTVTFFPPATNEAAWWCYITRNNKVLCPLQELVIPNTDGKNLDIAIISALVKCHIVSNVSVEFATKKSSPSVRSETKVPMDAKSIQQY